MAQPKRGIIAQTNGYVENFDTSYYLDGEMLDEFYWALRCVLSITIEEKLNEAAGSKFDNIQLTDGC